MMKKERNFESVADLINTETKFILGAHVQPDGDAIGSLLGLGLLLMGLGKEVFMSWGEPISAPPQYSFLPGIELLKDPSLCPSDIDNFIALDCATIDRLGVLAKVAKKTKNLVNIDHHHETERFGTVNILNEQSSSTSDLLLDIANALSLKLNKDIATCFYVGVVTDTGRFQYSNTTADTFRAAEELLGYGVEPNQIFQNLYERTSFEYVKLQGRLLERAQLVKDQGLIYTWILQDDFRETNAKMAETENLIDSLRSVKGIRVAAVLKQMGNEKFNVSLRAKGEVNVSKLAEQFGGGGHPNAAGFKSAAGFEKTLESLIEALKEMKSE